MFRLDSNIWANSELPCAQFRLSIEHPLAVFCERSGTSADATKGGSQQQQRLLLLLLCCAVYVFAAPPTEFIIRVSLTDF
jgi:hypothetical protein